MGSVIRSKSSAITLPLFGIMLLAMGSEAQARGDKLGGKFTAQRWCTPCHSLGRDPSPNASAPTFATIKTKRTRNQIKAFLFAPHGQMPPLELSRRQIEDLAAFIKSVKTKAPPGKSGGI